VRCVARQDSGQEQAQAQAQAQARATSMRAVNGLDLDVVVRGGTTELPTASSSAQRRALPSSAGASRVKL
jgi:hypothetical protein